MMGRTHALSGAVGMLAVTPAVSAVTPSLTPHGPVALAAGTVVAAGAALLPDLDHPRATVARSLGPVTGALSKVVAAVSGGHRQATHSVAGVLLAAGLFGVAGSAGGWWAWVPVTLLAGLAVAAVGLSKPVAAWAGAGLVVAASAVAGVDLGSWLGLSVAIGCAAHLAGDCATVQGCPLLWPWRRRYEYAHLRTGGRGEQWTAAVLVTVLAAEVLITTMGTGR